MRVLVRMRFPLFLCVCVCVGVVRLGWALCHPASLWVIKGQRAGKAPAGFDSSPPLWPRARLKRLLSVEHESIPKQHLRAPKSESLNLCRFLLSKM